MIEGLLLGALAYGITWYKSIRIAVWVGVGIVIFALVIALAFFVLVAGAHVIGLITEIVSLSGASLQAGDGTAWFILLYLGILVVCYVVGVYLAVVRKRRKGLET